MLEEVKQVDADYKIEVDPQLKAMLEPILTSPFLSGIKALIDCQPSQTIADMFRIDLNLIESYKEFLKILA